MRAGAVIAFLPPFALHPRGGTARLEGPSRGSVLGAGSEKFRAGERLTFGRAGDGLAFAISEGRNTSFEVRNLLSTVRVKWGFAKREILRSGQFSLKQ